MVTFLGLVRNHNLGRSVRYLEYEGYEPLALRAFERISEETAARWPGVRLALHHRIGRLDIGEASVAIVTAFGPPRRCVRRVPLCDRTGQADCARSGSTSSSRAATSGSRVRQPIPTTNTPEGRGGAGRVRVTVRLFARLRDIAGTAELAREAAPGDTIAIDLAAAGE